jgi:hypothetical protein
MKAFTFRTGEQCPIIPTIIQSIYHYYFSLINIEKISFVFQANIVELIIF